MRCGNTIDFTLLFTYDNLSTDYNNTGIALNAIQVLFITALLQFP